MPSLYVQTNASPDAYMALEKFICEKGPFENIVVQVSGGTHPGRKIPLHKEFMELIGVKATHFAGSTTSESYHYRDQDEDVKLLAVSEDMQKHMTSNGIPPAQDMHDIAVETCDTILIMDVPHLFVDANKPVKAETYLYASHLFALEPTVESFNNFKALFVNRLNLYSAISIDWYKGANTAVYAPKTETPVTAFIKERIEQWNAVKNAKGIAKLERLQAIVDPDLKTQQDLEVQVKLVEALKVPGQFPIAATMLALAEKPDVPVVLKEFNGRYPVWDAVRKSNMYAHEWRPLEDVKKARRDVILDELNA